MHFLGLNFCINKGQIIRDRAVLMKRPLFTHASAHRDTQWPLACRRAARLLLLYLSLLSWSLALDKGCSAMNSSLKATVLEYIYKWTEKGWTYRSVSSIHHLETDAGQALPSTCPPWGAQVGGTHTWPPCAGCWLCHQKILLFNLTTTLQFCRETELRINAGSPSLDRIFSCYSW